MSFKQLRDIVGTSHFRMAAYFLVVFGLAGALLMGYVYWQTSVYLAREVDDGLQTNVERWSKLPPETLVREVSGRVQRDPSRRQPAILIGSGGTRVAGSLDLTQPIPRYDAPFDAMQRGPDGTVRPLRALASVIGSGLILVIGQDVRELGEFDERLRTAIIGGAFIIIGVGLTGAIALGRSAKRRLDAMTRSLQRIVKGDLAERLPTHNQRDDLDRIAAMVNAMLDEIERLMGEVKGVTDEIAHDLRTPLTRMLSGLDRAQNRDPTREELTELMRDTADDARLLLRMFKGLLRISEIENSARRGSFRNVDLTRIARDVVDLFDPVAQDKGVGLKLLDSSGSVSLQGDADLLFDALSNLVDNAIKFTPHDGEVTLQVQAVQGGVHLIVADTGPGIEESERTAVLRRFYRSEKSRHEPGHGLGLSLVAAVARLHDMTLTIVDACPGCRIKLSVPLPRRSAASNEIESDAGS
jgi:signal transduction histidine kinase